ncbi:adenylate isopentenyltransferase-like [Eucalyptus grandis]|uniref:adenylate isopentenyltransferase-like n=1 Tax=Eucalyptus grandis TaxID=71139 RepID=UPI00192E990D|nr:adenylate isopentenyltransferase-like [Eucalyptus grandis]
MASSSSAAAHRRPKVVVIIGATGCGKSRLSIDVASHFPSEVINSDKTQVYRGLDITPNKIAPADRRGFPHHLLGSLDPDDGEMTPSQFRSLGDDAISDVASRGNLPILALLAERFGPLARPDLRYDCCFLCVDVLLPVLKKHLPKRVDRMLRVGAFDELVGYYDLRWTNPGAWAGLRKAIGVLEFDRYFEKYPPPRGVRPGDAWGRAGGEQPSGCLCRRHNSEVPRL